MFDFRLYLICTIEINVDSSLYVHQSVYLMGEAAESNKECILSQVCLTVIVIIIIYYPQPIRSSSNYTFATRILSI